MNLTYVSTYPPRECGLATFNKNLMGAVASNFSGDNHENKTTVIALNEGELDEYAYPPEVDFIIRKQTLSDYTKAADRINASDTDACILQHEFGIYGGDSGIYVLPLIYQIEKPLITVLHTVLKNPSYQQKTIIQNIAKRSHKVVVMGKIAIKFLTEIYDISRDKICYIEHGVPDIEPPVVNPIKANPQYTGRKLLLTFGLISRNKGLETVVKALPQIAEQHPDVLYMILGNTHPGIIKSSGEEYREHLVKLADELGVKNNLVFVNRYVTEEELIDYISAADVYVTPYLNEAQITSGTLSYAVGAGSAVVSTPYWHATELLTQGRGRLFDFKDEIGLAETVIDLLGNDKTRQEIKDKAYQYGLKLRWPVIGGHYIDILDDAIAKPDLSEKLLRQIMDVEMMPELSLDYVKCLTDSTGIIQHAKYGIPNWKEGYCIDDNARALIMALMAQEDLKEDAAKLLPTYISFIHYMQNDDGSFRNFLSYGRQYLDEVGSEDAFGRTIWSLGCLILNSPNNSYAELGVEMFRKAAPHFDKMEYIRGISNTLIGISYYLKVHPTDHAMQNALHTLTDKMVKAYKQAKDENWSWYENYLTYDNAILPLSLLHSAEITGDKKVLKIAFESIKFLEELTVTTKYLNPVGNNGWYYKNGQMPLYDQQAIETMGMALLYTKAYEMTADAKYLKRAFSVYFWFLGENSLWSPLYDEETKGCSDGLQLMGINRNQGAESTLAYLISHLAVVKASKTKEEATTGTIMPKINITAA